MSNIKKHFIFILLAGLICCPGAARAQGNYYNATEADAPAAEAQTPQDGPPPPAQTVMVTSISKCYAALSREDALDIQRNFIKPYQECQRRLALKLKKKQESKAGEIKDKPPETPSGFYRVQQAIPSKSADADAPQETGHKKPEPPESVPDKNEGAAPEEKTLPEARKPDHYN